MMNHNEQSAEMAKYRAAFRGGRHAIGREMWVGGKLAEMMPKIGRYTDKHHTRYFKCEHCGVCRTHEPIKCKSTYWTISICFECAQVPWVWEKPKNKGTESAHAFLYKHGYYGDPPELI